MDPRPHPFAAKLSPDQAEEVRRLRARGAALAELAAKFGVAKSSISAVVHYHAHAHTTSTFTVMGAQTVMVAGRTVLPELLLDEGDGEDGAR